MDDRKEPIHQIGYLSKMRGTVVTDVDRVLAVPPAKLRDIHHGSIIQCPQSVFVESLYALLQAYLNAVVSKSYCRSRFRSWILAKRSGSSFSLDMSQAP
jgi:hypothetical protein